MSWTQVAPGDHTRALRHSGCRPGLNLSTTGSGYRAVPYPGTTRSSRRTLLVDLQRHLSTAFGAVHQPALDLERLHPLGEVGRPARDLDLLADPEVPRRELDDRDPNGAIVPPRASDRRSGRGTSRALPRDADDDAAGCRSSPPSRPSG